MNFLRCPHLKSPFLRFPSFSPFHPTAFAGSLFLTSVNDTPTQFDPVVFCMLESRKSAWLHNHLLNWSF
ncbi:MAG TPA: hypothetical protein PLS03_05110, partial [Terrimicrobiaceae bacterium]|nr:hypothetical protein [Terrimicrobiaceae bacterium]